MRRPLEVGRSLLLLVVLLLLVIAADTGGRGRAERGITIRVPQDQPTIQAGADAAGFGDVVLVDVGTWVEQIELREQHAGITIRGVDRNDVVLDGRGALATAILVNGADGVRLENLTARNYLAHGFSWQSVEGWVGRYLTASRIGVYGIYAFDSRLGLLEHSFASGSADAAIYIGQCDPCDATVRQVIGAHATMGFSGTNASGNLVVEDSQWHDNAAGLMPNSLDSEALPPQRVAILRRNVVRDSGVSPPPSKVAASVLGGIGIVIGGGVDDIVEDNLVIGSRRIGIAIGPQPSDTVWQAVGNTVRRNIVQETGPDGVDLAIVAEPGSGNCFEQNTFATSDPPEIETVWSCSDRDAAGGQASAMRGVVLAVGQCASEPGGCGPAATRWDRTPEAPRQPTMPPSEAGGGDPGGPDGPGDASDVMPVADPVDPADPAIPAVPGADPTVPPAAAPTSADEANWTILRTVAVAALVGLAIGGARSGMRRRRAFVRQDVADGDEEGRG